MLQNQHLNYLALSRKQLVFTVLPLVTITIMREQRCNERERENETGRMRDRERGMVRERKRERRR